MASETTTTPSQRQNRTIILPISQEQYDSILNNHEEFHQWIAENYALHPELFPAEMKNGYKLNGTRTDAKIGLVVRRIRFGKNLCYSIWPSFAMPYGTALAKDVEHGLLLRKWNVPYEVLADIFGRNAMFWYRLETSFGRYSIVGTTIKATKIPTDLLADEKHEKLVGEKVYIATTVGAGCVLGAEFSSSASGDDLKKAYGVFKEEALAVEPEYAPSTVNTDGWNGTQSAWSALFPMVVMVRCFLHAWLKIRERSKNLKALFFEIGERVWNVYHAPTRAMMSQRIRRLRDWATQHLSGVVLEKVLDLCAKSHLWSVWYDHGGHATSNMLDRLMRSQNKYFDRGQHLHGDKHSANKRCRAWAILHNYWPWCRKSVKDNDGARCPAERLNKKRYHDNWLQNLLVATSNSKKQTPKPL
jgi:hypothetical protein